MSYTNKLIVSKSNPILVPNQNQSVYTPNPHLHSSHSSHNLNHLHLDLANNLEEIREVDARLQEGIHDARSKLLKTLKVGREITTTHTHQVNWESIIEQKNERIRQLEFELHEAKTRIIQMQSMFQQKQMEIQKFVLIIRQLEQKLRLIVMEKDKSSENERLINQLRISNSERDSLIIKIKDIEKDKNGQIANLNFTIKQLQNRYDSFESLKKTQIDGLASKLQKYSQQISKFSQKEQFYASLMKATEEYEFLNSQLAQQLKSKYEDIRQLEERVKFLESKNRAKQEQIANLQAKCSTIDSDLSKAQQSLRLNANSQDERKESNKKTELLENELTLKETIISQLNIQYSKDQEEWKAKQLKWSNDQKTWRLREENLEQSVRELKQKQLNWQQRQREWKSQQLKWLSNDRELRQLVEKLEQQIRSKQEQITKLQFNFNQLTTENLRLVGQTSQMQNSGAKEKQLLENLRGAQDFIQQLQKQLNKIKGLWNKQREEMDSVKNELKRYELFERELEAEKNKNKQLYEQIQYSKNEYKVSMQNIQKANQSLKEAQSSQYLLNSQGSKIKELESLLNSQRAKVQDAESFAQNDRNRILELQSLLNAQRLRSTEFQSQLSTQTSQIERANSQTIASTQLQMQGHISEKNKYLSENAQLRSDIQKLRRMLDSKERQRVQEIRMAEKQNNDVINGLRLTISNLERQVQDLTQQTTTNKTHSEELLKIQIENQFLKQRLVELQKSILLNSDQQFRIQQLESENANIIQQINFLSEELKRLNSELQRLSAQLQRNNLLYQTEKDKLLKQISLLTEKKQQMHRNLISAEGSMKKYMQQIQQLKLQIEKQVQRSSTLTSQQNDKIQWQNDLNLSSKRQQELKQTIMGFENQNTKLKQEVNALQQKLVNSNNLQSEIRTLKLEVERLQKIIQDKSNEKVGQKSSELDELKDRISLLEKTISSHNSLIESLQNDQNSLRNQKSEIERVKDQLGINVRSLSDDLELSQKRQREVKAKLEEKIKELTDHLNEMASQLARLEEQKAELEAQLKAAQLYQNSLLDDLNDKLIDIERGKSTIILSLEKKRIQRELNLKLEEASNKIEQLQTQLKRPRNESMEEQGAKTNQYQITNNSNIMFEEQQEKVLFLQNLLVQRDQEINTLKNEKSLALEQSNVLHLELEGIRDQFNVSSANAQQRVTGFIQKINEQFSQKSKNYEAQIEGYDATIRQQNQTILNLQQTLSNQTSLASPAPLQELQSKNNKLQQDHLQLATQRSTLQSQFVHLQQKLTVVTDELGTQTQKLVQMEQNLFNAENYIEEQEKQIDSLRQSISQLQSNSNGSSNIISELNSKINSLEHSYNNLTNETIQKDKVIDEYKQKVLILESNQALISKSSGESSNQLIQLNKQLATLKLEQQNQVRQFSLLQKSLFEKENEINEKNTAIQNSVLALTEKDTLFNKEQEKHLIQVSQMQREIEQYHAKIQETLEVKGLYENSLRDSESLRVENSNLSKAFKIKQEENIQLNDQNTKLSAVLSQTQQEFSTMKAHSQNLENIVSQVSEQNSNLVRQIQFIHANLSQQISERQEYIQELRNDLTRSEQNNDQITVALGQQKQEISAMIMEIANLQIIGKKNEGDENELVNSLKNQLSQSQREKLNESKLLQNEILNLKKQLNAIEREKYEVQVQIQNIDGMHQSLLANYSGLKQALQEIVEVQQKQRQIKNESSPNRNTHNSPFKQPSVDKYVGEQSDLESRQVFGHINRISVLLGQSNSRIEQLVAVNEELNRRVQEHDNAFRQLLQKVNNQKGERSGESSVVSGFGDHPLNLESTHSTEISNSHMHDEIIRNQNEMLKKTVSVLQSELFNKANGHKTELMIEQVHKIIESVLKFNIHEQHHQVFYPSINQLTQLNNVVWQKLSEVSAYNQSGRPINADQGHKEPYSKQSDGLGEKHGNIVQQRYQQVLQQLILFQSRNKELISQIDWLHNQLNKYKSQVEQLSKGNKDSQFELKANVTGLSIDLKQNNYSKEEEILKQNPSHFSNITEIEFNSKRSSQPQHSRYKLHLNQLQLLEQQLLQNEKQINNSCQNVDMALKDIKGLIDKDDEDTIDKTKIKKLLDSLEVSIKENQKLHKNEISNMANTFNFGDKSDRFPSDDGELANVLIEEGRDETGYKTERVVISDRLQLIKEVKELRRLINVFDHEARKRKAHHDQTVNGFRNEISKLQDFYAQILHESNAVIQQGSAQQRFILKMEEISSQLEDQLQQTSRNEESRESLNFGEVEQKEILIRGQGVQIGNFMQSVRNSLNENDQKKSDMNMMQNMLTQANFDVKPFLDYVLQNHDFDKQDLLELKRKVASLKSKQNRSNMNYLSNRKQEMEMILEANRHLLNSDIDLNQFMEAIADNIEPNEIIQLLQNNQNSANFFHRFNEVLNAEPVGHQHAFRQINSQLIAEEVRQIMFRYSPEGSKMGQTLYQFILLMLASHSDDALLNVIDNFFSVAIQIEQFYIGAIEEKDRMFQEHKEVMSKMLQKSSSSEESEGEGGSVNFREQTEEIENEADKGKRNNQ